MSDATVEDEFESHIDFDEPMWPREVAYDPTKHASNNANQFMKERERCFSRLICSDSDLYSLDYGQVWKHVPDADIMTEIRKTDPGFTLDITKIATMVREIKTSCGVQVRPFEWITEPRNALEAKNLILARNGIYDVGSGELLDHTSDYFATGVPEWFHDDFATCPKWLAFLDQVLDKSFHPTLQEWFGYTMTPDTRLQKFAVLIGVSRGGKGTIKNVLEQLTGAAHRGSATLNDLAGDFGLQSLMDKRLIIVPDASDTEVSKRSAAIERIKSMVGGDKLSVNRKNKTLLNDVRIPAKLTLLANRHPKFIDESGALAIRQLVFNFERSFAGREDLMLGEKLTAELSGIANWAIEGLRRLRERGEFTIGSKGKVAQADLKQAQSPALRFASEWLDVTGSPDDMVPLTKLFEAYSQIWVYDEGLKSGEVRNRTDFRDDLLAALRSRGVRYLSNQVRWHDPYYEGRIGGPGDPIRARLTGLKMKPDKTTDLMKRLHF